MGCWDGSSSLSFSGLRKLLAGEKDALRSTLVQKGKHPLGYLAISFHRTELSEEPSCNPSPTRTPQRTTIHACSSKHSGRGRAENTNSGVFRKFKSWVRVWLRWGAFTACRRPWAHFQSHPPPKKKVFFFKGKGSSNVIFAKCQHRDTGHFTRPWKDLGRCVSSLGDNQHLLWLQPIWLGIFKIIFYTSLLPSAQLRE